MKEKLDGRLEKKNQVFESAREQIKHQNLGQNHIENMLKMIHKKNFQSNCSMTSKRKKASCTNAKDLGF